MPRRAPGVGSERVVPPRPRPSERRALLLAALLATAASWAWWTSPAGAHTGFESSSPADGEVVDEPVAEISIRFTGPANPIGEEFVVLEPTGTIRLPDAVTGSDDERTWLLEFDPALAGGDIGVRWNVVAPDAHPIDGSFSFTVTAPPPAPVTTAPEPADETAVPTTTVDPTTTIDPSTTVDAGRDTSPGVAVAAPAPPATGGAEPIELAEFLDVSDPAPTGTGLLATVSRIAGVLGGLTVVGGGAFALFVLRGTADEVRLILTGVRTGGLLAALGAVLEGAAHVATMAGAWSGVWSPAEISAAMSSSAGLAIGARLAGGALVVAGVHPDLAPGSRQSAREASLAVVGASAGSEPATRETGDDIDQAWDPSQSITAAVGAILIAGSFAFDGHTVSEGPRFVHGVANLIHVLSAGTWGAGVVLLAMLTVHRRRRNSPTGVTELAARFSVVATFALVAAGLAGAALSAVIVDSPSQLWTTPWGRLLVAKVALVAVAAGCGAYNHRVIVPGLRDAPSDPAIIDRFRALITVEAATLVAVAVTTGLLVGASTV